MNYTNDIAGRFEAAVCSLVLSTTAPDEVRATSLQADAVDYAKVISQLIEQQIVDKVDYLLHADPEEFRAYFDKWMARPKLDEEDNPHD